MGNSQGEGWQLGANAAARGGCRRCGAFGGASFLGRAMSFGGSIRALTRSNDRRFIELLIDQADLTVRALQVVEKFGRAPSGNDELVDEVKGIEREGDAKRRILIDELAHTYATPFDREDLFALSRAIDDILDAANETAVELAIYKIDPPEGLNEMAKVLVEGATHIRSAVGGLLAPPRLASEHAGRGKRSENPIHRLYPPAIGPPSTPGPPRAPIPQTPTLY